MDEVARLLVRADPPSSRDATPAWLVLAALAWHPRVGGAWRALPAGFPPWRTVYGWFRRRIDNQDRQEAPRDHLGTSKNLAV